MDPLFNHRKDYSKSTLSEENIVTEPIAQFKIWLKQAIDILGFDGNAMIISTVDKNLMPSSRVVLLKNIDDGFWFFTNYDSKKAQHISYNPQASLLFFWHTLERQVRIEGQIKKLSKSISKEYFEQRPIESRLGAVISPQSAIIPNRQWLDERFNQMLKTNIKPKKPNNWGGYKLIPQYFEFWQGGKHRLHDRIVYQKTGKTWKIMRLAP